MNSRERAVELRKRMNIEEKIAQMLQISYSQVSHREALVFAKMGAGGFLHVRGDEAREIQEEALKSRLAIPLIFGINGAHGYAVNSKATIFPSCLAMASSFDLDLVRTVARVTAKEMSDDALHWNFSTPLSLGRDLRWGRVGETFGEDPLLVGEMAKAMIEGYQNQGDLSADDAILACAKHFVGYGEATGGRDSYDSPIPERQPRTVFLPPFQKAIDAGVASVMAGYGSVDRLPCSANRYLLKNVLQEEMGFKGVVVTNWENVRSIIEKQFVARDIHVAAYKAITSGNHMIMNTPEFYGAALDLVNGRLVDESLIDEGVDRILTMKFELGLFDNHNKVQTLSCKPQPISSSIGSKEHEKINEEITKRSMVLLKNDGILPLFKNGEGPKRIALIGPNCDDVANMLGDWTYLTHQNQGIKGIAVDKNITLKAGLDAISQQYDFDIYYEKACNTNDINAEGLKKAIRYAQTCDLVILGFGDGIEEIGEKRDRANLELPLGQRAVLEAMIDIGTPIVTVFISSKPMDIYDLVKFSSAVIYGFNWGNIGGEICAKILAGEINPSGKLPISFPRHTGQLPVYYNQLPGWHGGKYVDFHQTPLFSFGHGLSYSEVVYRDLSYELNFELEKLDDDPIERLKQELNFSWGVKQCKDKYIRLSFYVENLSDIPCEEVVLVFVRDEVASTLTPVKELKAFKRIILSAYESQKVEMTVALEQLCLINEQYKWVLERGDFIFMVKDMEVKIRL